MVCMLPFRGVELVGKPMQGRHLFGHTVKILYVNFVMLTVLMVLKACLMLTDLTHCLTKAASLPRAIIRSPSGRNCCRNLYCL